MIFFSRTMSFRRSDFRLRNDWRYRKLVNMLAKCRGKMGSRIMCRWFWGRYTDAIVIDFHCDESELIMSHLKSTLRIRVGSNVINSRARFRSGGTYVTSAAVNLMIYTGGRKTNEWIHLARVRTYGATWNKHSWIFAGITPIVCFDKSNLRERALIPLQVARSNLAQIMFLSAN